MPTTITVEPKDEKKFQGGKITVKTTDDKGAKSETTITSNPDKTGKSAALTITDDKGKKSETTAAFDPNKKGDDKVSTAKWNINDTTGWIMVFCPKDEKEPWKIEIHLPGGETLTVSSKKHQDQDPMIDQLKRVLGGK